MGFLTGKIDRNTRFDEKTDLRSGFDRFSPENLAVIDVVKRFALGKGATPAQLSVAWLLAQKPWIVPIPGTRDLDHLTENHGAINIALTKPELRELDAALASVTVHGGRMNEPQMQIVDQTY